MTQSMWRRRSAAPALVSFVLILVSFLPRIVSAEEKPDHPAAVETGKYKIVPKNGIWFIKFPGDKPFYLEVKKGKLSGIAGISYVLNCGGYAESSTDYYVDLSKKGGKPGHLKTVVPLHFTGPNSFTAVVVPVGRHDNLKIKITVKGSFASATSMSGTVSVSSSMCDPTVTSWEGAPGGK